MTHFTAREDHVWKGRGEQVWTSEKIRNENRLESNVFRFKLVLFNLLGSMKNEKRKKEKPMCVDRSKTTQLPRIRVSMRGSIAASYSSTVTLIAAFILPAQRMCR